MRQKDCPKQLLIGDDIWTIRFCRRVPGEAEKVLGLCSPDDLTIWLKMGQSSEERLRTLIHEVCHAVCFSYGIKECHRTIYRLEMPILRLFRDNGLSF